MKIIPAKTVTISSSLTLPEFRAALSEYVDAPTKFYKLRWSEKPYEGTVLEDNFTLVSMTGGARISGRMEHNAEKLTVNLKISVDRITAGMAVGLTVGLFMFGLLAVAAIFITSGIIPHPGKIALVLLPSVASYWIGRLRLEREVNRNLEFFERKLLG